jgi:uroporphyrinogen-III synthase
VTVPLAGRVVLVTRPGEQGAALARRLRDLGAEAIEAPTIVVEAPPAGGPLDRAVEDAAGGRFAWVVFTSAAGVAGALRARGLEPGFVPEAFTTADLGRTFPHGSGRVLLARADLATGELEEAVRARGWDPVHVEAYRVRVAGALPDGALAALGNGRVDAATFTSPSTVEGFVRLAGAAEAPMAVCIGPVTAAAAGAAGLDVVAVAEPHTEEGLVTALIEALGAG